jgi:large subunit ribosomal protein L9
VLAIAKDRAELIDGMELVIPANAGEEGKLFGSVGPIDIVDAFSKVDVERAEVCMPEGLINELGEFQIGVHLCADINVDVNLKVVADE